MTTVSAMLSLRAILMCIRCKGKRPIWRPILICFAAKIVAKLQSALISHRTAKKCHLLQGSKATKQMKNIREWVKNKNFKTFNYLKASRAQR